MAIYHFCAKPISRKSGRSATAAAAYRAGVVITDERTGQTYDYTRKRGVLHTELILPGGGTVDRGDFWSSVELHHKRGDAVLVREIEVSLPTELTREQRQDLAVDYARELSERYGVAADVALHAPRPVTDRDLMRDPDQYYEIDPQTGKRHNGNWHAHIMLSACYVEPSGQLGKKAVELDPIHCQRAKIDNAADRERGRWADLVNAALARHGQQVRVDHRSHAERGIDAEPGQHRGPAASGYERRTGEPSRQRLRHEAESEARAAAKELAEIERVGGETERQIVDLSRDLEALRVERDAIAAQAERERVELEQAAQRLADRERIERMTSAELAAEIERRRQALPRVDDLVERDPDVRLARAELERIEAERERAERQQERAARQASEWRERHKISAWLHDKGIGYSETLRELEQQRQRAKAAGRAAAREFDDAFSADRSARIAAREYIDIQQMWPQLEIEKLQSLRAEKLQQERLEAERQRKESRAEKRRGKGLDDGPGWSR